ncbi:hypothetical protein CLOM_g4844 [Closterium sp. NIES-68]|nr:hypothetical protein CLOM_g4844 [Closterium sp. NIES-68]
MALELAASAAITSAPRPAPPPSPPPNLFAVTGFKPFLGVAKNPTEAIVRALPAYLAERNALPEGWALGCCCVLETAGKGYLPQLLRILDNPEGLPPLPPLLPPAHGTEGGGEGAGEKGGWGSAGGGVWGRIMGKGGRRMALGESALTGSEGGEVGACAEEEAQAEAEGERAGEAGATKSGERAAGFAHPAELAEGAGAGERESRACGGSMGGRADAFGGRRVIWVHLGVNSGASKIAVERQAANEATFRCPDEMGWQPQREPIAPEDGPITVLRQTTLPVLHLVDTLHKRGFTVCTSFDAGRFVCNYSLGHAATATITPSTTSTTATSPTTIKAAVEFAPAAAAAAAAATAATAAPVHAGASAGVGSDTKHNLHTHPQSSSHSLPALSTTHTPQSPAVAQSMQSVQQHLPRVQSVFVHVPTFETISEAAQLRFVAALLELLACTCPPDT